MRGDKNLSFYVTDVSVSRRMEDSDAPFTPPVPAHVNGRGRGRGRRLLGPGATRSATRE
jgi:hypothetical protein